MSSLPRVLLLAENCNPEWPSLPIVGYKYARALARVADVTIATHIRNRENIEKAGELADRVHYIDNEWIARRMYRLSTFLRGGNEVAWSTNQIMAYPPYVAFERQILREFDGPLQGGEFDLVHRITPMSPTLPSYASGRTKQPFLIGPLNGNLDWPAAFNSEQKREREGLRRLRGAYRYLPFAQSTFRHAACIMAAFQHTIDDLPKSCLDRVVPFPEVGFDPAVFHPQGRQAPFSVRGPKRFLFAGRLVPYKVPEAAIRAFATSQTLQDHVLHVLGDGPEQPRLEHMVAEAGARDRVIFEGRKTQAEVADFMRRCDAFVFPSIRELGAGVVVEAMASGMVCLVTNYGAPGDLVAGGRGVRIDLQPMDGLVRDYQAAMEHCVAAPQEHAAMAQRGADYARTYYDWDAKAAYTARLYQAVLKGENLGSFTEYR
ncbi:glycosyltransferase family 4 protein [Roseobacter sp. YSTF-M11]|uniref:Glycosyltransferase family 4 protein n=1 Tax=Roseobacter insulae TaxID=2859783 RepID=A0A9X1G042_9RHOB|nr:glycosyltransferase family 4 protein [Roseobacter insulae]MBW4710778.1 glycosyltransferase family 4 protein [Roseobacter insulae]